MFDPRDKNSNEEQDPKELNKSAFEEAQHDIDSDGEFKEGNENDDLDEEESRELGDPGLGF